MCIRDRYNTAESQISQWVTMAAGDDGKVRILLLKRSILTGDLTNTFFPLGTNLSTLGSDSLTHPVLRMHNAGNIFISFG